MANIIDQFKALTLEEQSQLHPQLTAVLEISKEARRKELRAELEALDGKAKSPPKYRSLKNPRNVWAGRGQEPVWMVEEMKETQKPREHFRVKDFSAKQ